MWFLGKEKQGKFYGNKQCAEEGRRADQSLVRKDTVYYLATVPTNVRRTFEHVFDLWLILFVGQFTSRAIYLSESMLSIKC